MAELLTFNPEHSPQKLRAQAAIDQALAGFKDPGLKPVPGWNFTMFPRFGSMDTVPAYVLPIRNRTGDVFVLPDFVRHDGLPKGGGFQDFGHDVHHLLENNVLQNLASPRWGKCWSELHKGGRQQARWRNGVLGDEGILAGKTVIVCAPGPSLKEKLPLIEEARKDPNVVVLVINRAVRGVRADYVLFVERWVPVEWRDEKVQELQKDATLITVPQADFKAVRDWPNDKVYWGYFNLGRYGADKRVNWLASLDPMASTTAACAVRVAYEMGAQKVLCCGMDFCCAAEPVVDKAPLRPEALEDCFENLRVLANAVSEGKGKQDKIKLFADGIIENDRRIIAEGWIPRWLSTYFYFDDVKMQETPYVRDPRFRDWRPVRSMSGTPVHTVPEFISYAEQLRAVCAMIESGSDCRIINASPEGILAQRPMTFREALEWRDPTWVNAVPAEIVQEAENLYSMATKED